RLTRSARVPSDSGAPQVSSRGIMDQVRDYVASALCAPPEEVEVDWPLNTMGVDSLIVTELREMINGEFGVLLEKKELRGRTVAQIAHEVSELLACRGEDASDD
ncbi:MAG: acyl carrier protein, partial [Streptosporangiaceae bacterium]